MIGAAVLAILITLGVSWYQLKNKRDEEQRVNYWISEYNASKSINTKSTILDILYTTYYKRYHSNDPSYLAKLNEKIGFNIERRILEIEEDRRKRGP